MPYVLTDLGPWDQFVTIANNPEEVVRQMVELFGPDLGGGDLMYYDSDGDLTRLVVRKGKFLTFAHITQ